MTDASDKLKADLLADYRRADISDTDKLILEYAEKITRDAASIDRAYIESLKARGLSDHTLHDIVQVSAYFAYVNRLADGLGVELEEG
ncbi:MAG: peroxidase [candidate division Zixibacteria bacterium]|nr:peroxidase [candidate division Zixibacteria bacterium]